MASSDDDTEGPAAFSRQAYCGEGVKNDFQKAVDKFLSIESVRYSDFLMIWKEMHFAHIYRGRQTLTKLREFIEECLRLACELWIESADFQVQVCGLYLLFGLYCCQPTEPKSKIRMTLAMWQAVQEFVAAVKEYNHCDVEYVYMRLILAKAFHFVATVSNENAVQDLDYRRQKILAKEEKEHKEPNTMIQHLLEPDNLLKLEVIDQQYHQMKRNLTGSHGTPDLSLSVIQTDLIEAITHNVTNFRSRRLGALNRPTGEVLRTETISTRACNQASVKQRAAAGKAPKLRNRRKPILNRSQSGSDIDQEAMAAAVQTALGTKGRAYGGFEMLSSIGMPSMADLDGDTLMIDESQTPKRGRKSGGKKAAENGTKSKRSKSTDTKTITDQPESRRRSKSATKQTEPTKEAEMVKELDVSAPLERQSPSKSPATSPSGSRKVSPKSASTNKTKTPAKSKKSSDNKTVDSNQTNPTESSSGGATSKSRSTKKGSTSNTPSTKSVDEIALNLASPGPSDNVNVTLKTSPPKVADSVEAGGAGDAPVLVVAKKAATQKKRSKTPTSSHDQALIPTAQAKKGKS